MSGKTKTTRVKGPREETGHKGKNGGPSIRQVVTKVISPC